MHQSQSLLSSGSPDQYFGLFDHVSPVENFHCPVSVFNQCSTAFYPVPAVVVVDIVVAGYFGTVNVTTDNPIDTLAGGFMRNGFFEVADVLHCIFDFVLEKGGQRPVGKTEFAPHHIHIAIGAKQILIETAANFGKQGRDFDDAVELIAMQDKQSAI